MSWAAVLAALITTVLESRAPLPAPPSPPGDRLARIAAARAADAKARFEAAEKRLDEFRNRARLLSTAVAFALGLELTLVQRLIELGPKPRAWFQPRSGSELFLASVVVFLSTVGFQVVLLTRLLEKGFSTVKQHGLPNPIDVMRGTDGLDEPAVHEAIGNAYANAAAAWDKANVILGPEVGQLARYFSRSMWCVFAVVVGLVSLVVLRLIGIVQ